MENVSYTLWEIFYSLWGYLVPEQVIQDNAQMFVLLTGLLMITFIKGLFSIVKKQVIKWSKHYPSSVNLFYPG